MFTTLIPSAIHLSFICSHPLEGMYFPACTPAERWIIVYLFTTQVLSHEVSLSSLVYVDPFLVLNSYSTDILNFFQLVRKYMFM